MTPWIWLDRAGHSLLCWTRTLWMERCKTRRSSSQQESSSWVSSAHLLRLLSLTWCPRWRQHPKIKASSHCWKDRTMKMIWLVTTLLDLLSSSFTLLSSFSLDEWNEASSPRRKSSRRIAGGKIMPRVTCRRQNKSKLSIEEQNRAEVNRTWWHSG